MQAAVKEGVQSHHTPKLHHPRQTQHLSQRRHRQRQQQEHQRQSARRVQQKFLGICSQPMMIRIPRQQKRRHRRIDEDHSFGKFDVWHSQFTVHGSQSLEQSLKRSKNSPSNPFPNTGWRLDRRSR